MQYSGCLQMLKDVQTLFFKSLFSAVAFGVLIGQSSQSLALDEVPRPGTSSRLRLHSLCQNRSFRLSNALDMPHDMPHHQVVARKLRSPGVPQQRLRPYG